MEPYTDERQQAHNKAWATVCEKRLQPRQIFFSVKDIERVDHPPDHELPPLEDDLKNKPEAQESIGGGCIWEGDADALKEVFRLAGKGDRAALVALYLSGRDLDEEISFDGSRTFVPLDWDPSLHTKFLEPPSNESCVAIALQVPRTGYPVNEETDIRELERMIQEAARQLDFEIRKLKNETGIDDTSSVIDYVLTVDAIASVVGKKYHAHIQRRDEEEGLPTVAETVAHYRF